MPTPVVANSISSTTAAIRAKHVMPRTPVDGIDGASKPASSSNTEFKVGVTISVSDHC